MLLYVDECTYYRQPSLARSYERQGHVQPLAYRSYRSNQWQRIIGALNALTGQVTFTQQRVAGRKELAAVLAGGAGGLPRGRGHLRRLGQLAPALPSGRAGLSGGTALPLAGAHPGNSPTQPSPQALRAELPIQLLCLPSYASWCNPIEKLWRWLRQNVLHLHRWADDWPALTQQVASALDGFRDGSDALLSYVGLAHALN